MDTADATNMIWNICKEGICVSEGSITTPIPSFNTISSSTGPHIWVFTNVAQYYTRHMQNIDPPSTANLQINIKYPSINLMRQRRLLYVSSSNPLFLVLNKKIYSSLTSVPTLSVISNGYSSTTPNKCRMASMVHPT